MKSDSPTPSADAPTRGSILSVVEATNDAPARKIPRNYIHVTGMHPRAARGASAVAFESLLEADLLILADLDPQVRTFITQPVTITWFDGSRPRNYTPDVLIHFTDKAEKPSWLCEVKTRRDLKRNWEKYAPKFRAATRYARERGYIFKIITEKEIRSQFQTNATFLLPFKTRPGNKGAAEKILGHLDRESDAFARDLMPELFPDPEDRAVAFATLWHLVATHQVETNLHTSLVDARLRLVVESRTTSGLSYVTAACSRRRNWRIRGAKESRRQIRKGIR